MPSYRLDIEYDGSDFHGWQVQPGQRTVQGVLATALATLFGVQITVVGAGRTDAGVHARGQTVSFYSEVAVEPRRIVQACAALLPDDMRVWRAGLADDGFSARSDAMARRYRYRMTRRQSPLGRRQAYGLRYPVDPDRMAEAATALLGRHDFSAFAASRTASTHRVCTVELARIESTDSTIEFEIVADRFLHNMVRRLTGCLVEVGRNRLVPADVVRILAGRDARVGGPCLPACGLVLIEARYPADPVWDRSVVVDGPAETP